MRVLCCGDRAWTDWPTIRTRLEMCRVESQRRGEDLVVIHGDNGDLDPETMRPIRGADKIAGWIASDLGATVFQFPAEWRTYGRAAGPIRNRAMLKKGVPDLVIAFHTNIRASRGTRNMLEQANRAGVPCVLIDALLPPGSQSGTLPETAPQED